jgi:hypothetical protein
MFALPPESGDQSDVAPCLLCADFVAEVGNERCVAAGADFFDSYLHPLPNRDGLASRPYWISMPE